MKILVVDDEKVIVKGIKFNLENEGYEVDVAYDGAEAVEKAKQTEYDLVILDVMMHKMDGLEDCMHIRQFSNVPVIFLSAKTDDMDKLMGFENGGDDYVTKPFNILELKARVRALLRRSQSGKNEREESRVTIGEITIDANERNTYKNGRVIDRTAREFDIVELMMHNPGRVYSRENLLNLIWGSDYTGDIRTVDVHMRRLREKLEDNPAQPEYVLTKWGVGYYFKA